MTWYAKKTCGGQGLVIDEADGRSVAVAYDDKDAALLASSPELLSAAKCALADLESFVELYDDDRVHPARTTIYELITAIRNAEVGK